MAHTLPSETLRTCTDGTMSCLGQWTYTVTEGMFWVFGLLGFCVALFVATTPLGNNRAFAFASFTAITGAIWLASMGFMAWWIASAFILVGLVGLIAMINSKR